MAKRDIRIIVNDGAGKRWISCEREHLNKNDKVQWHCDTNHPFTIDFGWNTPLVSDIDNSTKEKIKSNKKGGGVGFESDEMEINAQIAAGYPLKFKYTIAVYFPPPAGDNDPLNGEVVMEDPEIIIDP